MNISGDGALPLLTTCAVPIIATSYILQHAVQHISAEGRSAWDGKGQTFANTAWYVCSVRSDAPCTISHSPDFATGLEKRLSTTSPTSLVDDQLLDSLQSHIRALHVYCQKPSQSFSGNEELDRLGTAIWNLSTRLMRDIDTANISPDTRKLAVYARVFAFHLLDAAQHSGKANLGNKMRLMRLALKAGRSSIGGINPP